jgi:soluble lytic murein transglycosylase-like protein
MIRALFIIGLMAAIPCGDESSGGFRATLTMHAFPDDFETVHEVLVTRALELAPEHQVSVARAIAEEAERAGFDPFLVLGMMDVESDFRPEANSSANAQGLMQIQPETLGWLMMREQWDLTVEEVQGDPALQVRLAVRYMHKLYDRFKTLDAALLAYNMGPRRYWTVKCEDGLDPYRDYATAVRRDATALKRNSGLPIGSMVIGRNDVKPPHQHGIWGG